MYLSLKGRGAGRGVHIAVYYVCIYRFRNSTTYMSFSCGMCIAEVHSLSLQNNLAVRGTRSASVFANGDAVGSLRSDSAYMSNCVPLGRALSNGKEDLPGHFRNACSGQGED